MQVDFTEESACSAEARCKPWIGATSFQLCVVWAALFFTCMGTKGARADVATCVGTITEYTLPNQSGRTYSQALPYNPPRINSIAASWAATVGDPGDPGTFWAAPADLDSELLQRAGNDVCAGISTAWLCAGGQPVVLGGNVTFSCGPGLPQPVTVIATGGSAGSARSVQALEPIDATEFVPSVDPDPAH